jgi:calcineurin-like phosphoesterase
MRTSLLKESLRSTWSKAKSAVVLKVIIKNMENTSGRVGVGWKKEKKHGWVGKENTGGLEGKRQVKACGVG